MSRTNNTLSGQTAGNSGQTATKEAAGSAGRSGVPERPAAELPRFAPAVDIFDNGEEVVLLADMPGVPPGGVEVHLDRGNLTIRGRVDRPQLAGRWFQEEYRVGDYERAFTVGSDIDAGRIEAELKNGVLLLRLPKSEERKPRKIPVRAG